MHRTPLRPPFDPELDAVLEVMFAQRPSIGMDAATAAEMRQIGAGPVPGMSEDDLGTMGILRTEVTVPIYDGAETQASIFARSDHTELGPGIFYIHGGGMVTGHRLLGVAQALQWVVDHDAVLITIDYRLAPEFPDPYPVEDCYSGLVWAFDNARDIGIDAHRIIVSGASAGGGLAAGTALLARDRQGPQILAQMLLSPMIDDRDSTNSTMQFTGRCGWDRASNLYGWSSLLGDRAGTDNVSVYAAPARADDLSGLPPTFIDCGSAEVFRDEDVAFASKLWAAGVDAELHVWAGGFHGFDVVAPHAEVSRAAAAARDSWMARQIGKREVPY